MFKGKKFNRKNNRNNSNTEGSSSRSNNNNEVYEEMDINDIKLDTMRSRNTPNKEYMEHDHKGNGSEGFSEDVGRVYSRSVNSGSIGDVDDAPKLHRGLKARHVGFYFILTS